MANFSMAIGSRRFRAVIFAAAVVVGFCRLATADVGLSDHGSERIKPIPEGWTPESEFTPSVAGGPANDDCANSIPILDGSTPFSTVGSSTDGPVNPACNFSATNQVHFDIWFDYIATCSGTLEVSLCVGNYDTKMAFYSGAGCVGTILACNDDACSFVRSELTAPVTAGMPYKLRIGGYTGAQGTGTVTLTCEGSCPSVEILSSIPPSGAVDARQPSPPTGTPLQGVGSANEPIIVQLAGDIAGAEGCFDLCETATGGMAPNAIATVTEMDGGQYAIRLNRPITPGAVTTISYLGGAGFVTLISHPGNTNADNVAAPTDVLAVIDMLNGVLAPPHGIYSQDVDRSGAVTPVDILRTIDLLNGADAYVVWNGTPRPTNVSCP